MLTLAKRFAAAACVCGSVLALSQSADAQFGKQPAQVQRLFPINPNPQIAPGVSLSQYAYNVAVLGKTYSQIPPYLLGYNPYPQAVNYGPVYNPQLFNPGLYNPVYNPAVPVPPAYAGGYNPLYGGSPYTGGYTAGGVDPAVAGGGYTAPGYGGGYNPYYPYPYGPGFGEAAVIGSLGQLGLNQEQARLLREQANQAKLDTRKKAVDTANYVRENTYTYTQEQADIAKRILERVQKMPTEQEVVSGKSLNILIDDLSKLPAAHGKGGTVTLDEEVLKQLNVSGSGGAANIGLLRDNGRFTFPAVFDDKLFDPKLKKDVELQAQELFQQSLNAKLDKNALKDLKTNLRTIRDTLSNNINKLLSQGYLEGQRFLDQFDAAVVALERGDAGLNLNFQQKFAKGGKTVQELIQYMSSQGLKFVPATAGDERAYAALQTALSVYSVSMHNQVSAGKQ